MRPLAPRHLGLALALAGVPALAVAAGEWEQFLDQDGIRGFSRSVPGSRVLEVRSVVVVDARIEVVGEVLRDVEGLKRPGGSCYDARLLARPDRDHYTFLAAYRLPGPFDDRIAVVDVANRYDLDRGRVVAELHASRDGSVALPEDAVRIAEFEAQFVVEYLSRERTGVVYTSRVDPAGNIPAFLADGAARDGLLDHARSLREAVRKPEYVAAAAASPDAELATRLVGDPAAMRRVLANRLGELIRDPALVARLVAEPSVVDAFVTGDGQVGATLLLGFGSLESRRAAAALLLRRLLLPRVRDPAALDRFVADAGRLDRILSSTGADAEVAAFLAAAR